MPAQNRANSARSCWFSDSSLEICPACVLIVWRASFNSCLSAFSSLGFKLMWHPWLPPLTRCFMDYSMACKSLICFDLKRSWACGSGGGFACFSWLKAFIAASEASWSEIRTCRALSFLAELCSSPYLWIFYFNASSASP